MSNNRSSILLLLQVLIALSINVSVSAEESISANKNDLVVINNFSQKLSTPTKDSDTKTETTEPSLKPKIDSTKSSDSQKSKDKTFKAKPIANKKNKPEVKEHKLLNYLKANAIETFQWDPRGVEDYRQGPIMGPIKLMQDNFAIGYSPYINWTRAGRPNDTDYNYQQQLALYLAGPITKHISTWLQAMPTSVPQTGWMGYWDEAQLTANYGSVDKFIQIRGGQCYNWMQSGFSGADRAITSTAPFVYNPVGGFNPGGLSKSIDINGTIGGTKAPLSGRVTGWWMPPTSTSSDSNIIYGRSYGMNFVLEKMFGKAGISGFQSNLTVGNTPAFNWTPTGYAMNGMATSVVGAQQSPFVWWTSWLNKSFLDKEGYVRTDASFGLNVYHLHRNLDNSGTLPESHFTGYGYTMQLLSIPIKSYWTSILRYDQYRMSTPTFNDTQYAFTLAQALDFHLPNKCRLRVSVDLQRVLQTGYLPSNRIFLNFWPIW